jgi:hypothetical protein
MASPVKEERVGSAECTLSASSVRMKVALEAVPIGAPTSKAEPTWDKRSIDELADRCRAAHKWVNTLAAIAAPTRGGQMCRASLMTRILVQILSVPTLKAGVTASLTSTVVTIVAIGAAARPAGETAAQDPVALAVNCDIASSTVQKFVGVARQTTH